MDLKIVEMSLKTERMSLKMSLNEQKSFFNYAGRHGYIEYRATFDFNRAVCAFLMKLPMQWRIINGRLL